MTCPDLDQLTGPRTPAIDVHLADCPACRIVVDLAAERASAIDDRAACARFEDLLAVRGGLSPALAAELDAHLETCLACRAIANTMSPVDAPRQGTLPTIEASAYAFGKEVARGGMGRIVAAHDRRIGTCRVAVKELLAASGETAARFEREARITARLQHPGVVPIYEIGLWPDGTPFYAMRMVEGRTLSAALDAAENRLTLLPSLIAAAEAVAFAHAHDVIHRDLKPSNIMVGAFGETVVIDWGLAKDLGEAAEDDAAPDAGPYRATADGLTEAGAVMGTAAYMPPEQASGGTVDRRADVYALGAILYHLLSGHAPYRGGTSLETVERVKSGPPRRLPNSAPRDSASIVAKAMARDPADRYPSARELADELERFQTGHVVEAHAYSRGELMRRWLRRHRAAVIGSAAAFVALVVAGTIGLAGVLHERDIATAHEQKEHAVAVSLLEEQGRQELLADNSSQALAYFDAAMQQGLDTPALRLMLARALSEVAPSDHSYACRGQPRGIATSKDDSLVAAACGDEVQVWRTADRRLMFSVPLAGARVVRFSHDGRLLLGLGGKALAVDATTGRVVRELGGASLFGAFWADGEHAVIVHADGAIQIWSLHDDAPPREFRIPIADTDDLRAAASGDGRILAVATLAGHVEIWDTREVQRRAAYEHGGQVARTRIADDGGAAVSCGNDGSAKVWRASSPSLLTIAVHRAVLSDCAMSPDGRSVVLSSYDGSADVWDAHTGRSIAKLPTTGIGMTIAFSPDGQWIAGGGIASLELWAADTGALLARRELSGGWPTLAFHPTGPRVAVSSGGEVFEWEPAIRRTASFVPASGELLLDTTPDGRRALTQHPDGSLWLWDTAASSQIPHLPLRSRHAFDSFTTGPIEAFSDDGRRLMATTATGIAIVDSTTGVLVAEIPVRDVVDCWLDRTGHRVLISGRETSLLWDVDRGGPLATFEAGSHVSLLDREGLRLLKWRDGSPVEIWDVATQRATHTLQLSTGFSALGFDATGTRLLVEEQRGAFNSGLFELFDVDTGARLVARAGNSAGFESSGRLFTLFGSGRVEVWSAAEGRLLGSGQIRPPGGDDANPSPVVSDDGLFIAATDPSATTLAISSALDGRVLVKLDVQRVSTRLYKGGMIYWYGLTSRWIPGTHSLVSLTGNSSIWNLEGDHRTVDEIHRLIERSVPWQVVDGRLVAKLGRIEGRVLRGGGPAAEVRVFARREPLGIVFDATTRPDGTFAFDQMPGGAFTINAGGAPVTVNVNGRDAVHVELTTP